MTKNTKQDTREIKFRAWDSKENKWMFGYDLPNLGGFSIYGEVVLMGEWGAAAWDAISRDEPSRIKLMQYTGLKDKNGKEIYEGDIIEVWSDTEQGDFKHYVEVKWDNETARFILGDGSDWELEEMPENGEIIGNIYENPELLHKTGELDD